MQIKFKKLHKNATLPTYAKVGDAGMDCTTTSITLGPKCVEYKLGFAIEIPEGYVGFLFPRSSISNKDLNLANSIGVIDSGYRGEVSVRFRTIGNANWSELDAYKIGDRVCQLVVMPFPKIETSWEDTLTETERGSDGYGSSGV